MTYQGARAQAMASESGKAFEVLKVNLGRDGHVSEVLWGPVHAGIDPRDGAPARAPVADVVDAMHDGARVAAVFPASIAHAGHPLPARPFVIVEHADGRECITFEGAASPGRELSDLPSLGA